MSNRAFFLLLGTGTMLGLNFPLGKLALGAGVQPAIWAALISLGAGLALTAITWFSENTEVLPRRFLQFSLISGFVSYVMPNFLTFLVIPKIGSGLTAIMFALSPVVTALLSVILRVRPPNLWGLVGIGFGMLGALTIVYGRNSFTEMTSGVWLAAALFIPIFLGVGNVYRTMFWPDRASPRQLAGLTNLAAVPFLLAAALLMEGGSNLQALMNIPVLIIAQLLVSTTMFLMFFRLQQIGGPTYLSQIGYVAAAVGVVIGVALFGEVYPPLVWVGATVIAFGIVLSSLAQMRQFG